LKKEIDTAVKNDSHDTQSWLSYQAVEKPLVNIKNGVSLIACSVGFASCKTFGKQPKHPCFGA